MANSKSVSWHIIALTVILISLCAFCAPAHAGVSPDDGRSIYPGDSIIVGETNLNFFNATDGLISEGVILSNWADSHIVIPFNGSFDSSNYEDELVPGEYIIVVIVIDDEGYANYVIESYIFFVSPKLVVTTEVNGEEFDWITRGGDIFFEVNTNMWIIAGNESNFITYKLLDPYGAAEQLFDINGVPLTYIDVSGGDVFFLMLNTSGMRTGVYTLSMETDPDTNNGLDVEGPETSFEVRSKGVTIEANKEKQTVTKDIVFTISTTPHTPISLDVTWGRESKVTFGEGGTSAFGFSDKDGEFKIGASFADTGSYEITATEGIMDTTDSIFVEIVPYEAEVKTDKDIYHIGENVKITGSSTAGDSITLKIEDEIVATGLDVDGFDYTWNTEDKSPDSYKIAIWVKGTEPPFSDPYTDPPDDSVTIMLLRGGLFVDTSADFVALSDEFTIEGIVPGRDRVDIFTIAPDGGGGSGLDPDDIFEETNHNLTASGLTYETTGVDTDGEFETEKITVGKDVDTGTYLIAALHYGRDGVWGKSGSDNLLGVLSNNYATALGVKTTDQLLAILKYNTINAAGSDDLLGIATIKVEKGFVTLDEIEAVPLGKNIKISGTTNRQVDTSIIFTFEGLDETTPKLKPKIAKVKEDPDNFYNKFELEFDTASANIGRYEVTADDGDGHLATTTVNILLAEEPSVNVSTTPAPETEGQVEKEEEEAKKPTAKPVTPTPEPEEEAEQEQPGFELLLTIAGLLLTVTVLLRSRKRKRKK